MVRTDSCAVWSIGSLEDDPVSHDVILACSHSSSDSVEFLDRSGRPGVGSGGHEGRFSRDRLPVFTAGDHRKEFRHGRGRPLFDVVRPACPLPTGASPTVQGAPREVVVARDMLGPCEFSSLASCQKRFLWAYKEVDLTPHLVVHLALPSTRSDPQRSKSKS